MNAPLRLSKSRYLGGLQCHRRLWWQSHEPRADELAIDDGTRELFAQGTRVGREARRYVPGGVLVDFDWRSRWDGIGQTRRLIEGGAGVLYEAAFEGDGICVVADILERTRLGWTLIEVKSTTRLRDQHVAELALQTHVLEQAGLRVARVELMHLDRACRYPDLRNLFRRVDVTGAVRAQLGEVAPTLRRQRRMLGGALPVVEPAEHCHEPYDCPFLDRCRRPKAQAVGGDFAVSPALASALDALDAPLAYLDFETIWPAIPSFIGCRPYDQVPVQFSLHVERGGGVEHHPWLASRSGDPREAIAAALLRATRNTGTVLAWYAPFEQQRILELAEAVPRRADELRALHDRVVDLLTIVRDHVDHPAFAGGYGLKRALPVLADGLGYDDLAIGSGGLASWRLQDLMIRGEPRPGRERDELRDALLRYCERDTWALVMIMRKLRALARAGP